MIKNPLLNIRSNTLCWVWILETIDIKGKYYESFSLDYLTHDLGLCAMCYMCTCQQDINLWIIKNLFTGFKFVLVKWSSYMVL